MEQLYFGATLPQCPWVPPVLGELPSWADAKRVSIDVETRDDDLKELGPGVRRGAYIVGVSFAIEDDARREGYYLPIAHRDGDNLDREAVLAYLREQGQLFRGALVGANLGYDLDFLWEVGVEFPNVTRYVDVQTTDVLLDEWQDSYTLDEVAKRHGLPGKDEELLRMVAAFYGFTGKKVKQHLWKFPGRFVGPYAERDAREPLLVLRKQEVLLDAQQLWKAYDLECAVLPVLVRLRRRGVRVNLAKVRAIEALARQQVDAQCALVHHHCGIQFAPSDLWLPEAVERVLTRVGYKRPTDPDGVVHYLYRGVDSLVLGDCKHPAVAAIKRGRETAKIIEYCERTYKHVHDGRMHPTYHSLRSTDDKVEDGPSRGKKRGKGTKHGRMSATHDNIQQQPIRDDEWGEMWRDCFEPDDDCHWVSGDVSQQEPRIVVDKAARLGLPGAEAAAQRYRDDPLVDCHKVTAEITKLDRKYAKNIGNGMNYWMGDAKLARSIGMSTEWVRDERSGLWKEVAGPEARVVLDQFNENLPYIKQLLYKAKEFAEKRGYMLTTLGRRCRFRLKNERDRDFGRGSKWADTYKALNMAVQPEAAEQIKQIIVAADKAGIPQQMTVHDEINFSEPRGQQLRQAQELREIMLHTVEISLPWKVDLEVGSSWGKLTKIEKLATESM